MDWKVTTAPVLEPVTLAEAKLHLKVDYTADDALITELIKTARQKCEQFQNRAFIEQIITAKLDSFSNVIALPMPPLISVTTVKYLDTNGVQQTLANTYYDEDKTSQPGLITLGYNDSWPAVRSQHHAVEIIYKAGYGAAASTVPEYIKTATKLWLSDLYEARGGPATETSTGIKAAMNLLWPERIVPI